METAAMTIYLRLALNLRRPSALPRKDEGA